MGNQQPLNGNAGGDHDPRRQQQAIPGSNAYGGGGYPIASGGEHGGNPGYNQQHHTGRNQQGAVPGYGGGQRGGDLGGGGGAGNANAADFPKSGSDASMTILDGDSPALLAAVGGDGGGGDGTATSAPSQVTIENFLNDDTVPTVFRWEHGGRQVYITGTFNGWSRQIPMHRSGNDFTYIHNLKRGKHAFKFIVDDEWRFAPDQPTVADIEGRINNFIDVTDFKAYTGDREFEKEKAAAEYGLLASEVNAGPDNAGTSSAVGGTATTSAGSPSTPGGAGATTSGVDSGGEDAANKSSGMSNRPDRDGEVFSNTMPDVDDYTKEPPPLPPHLRHIILNKPPQLQDTAALPVPQHVALNHLYCTAIKDNMMVLGITQRFKTKFVTTVYYSPCASK